MDERDFFLSFSSSVPVTLNFNELNKSVKRSQLISDLLSRMDENSQNMHSKDRWPVSRTFHIMIEYIHKF